MSSQPYGIFAVLRFVPLVFVLIGAWLVVGGVRSVVSYRGFLRRAACARGVVTGHDVERHSSPEHGIITYWYPVLSFTTADGRRVNTRSMSRRRLQHPLAGTPVEVRYDPLDPLRATLPGSGNVASVTQVVIGAVFVPLGLAVFAVFTAVSDR